MPNALALGLDEKAFWDSNPADIKIYSKAEKIRLKNENFMMYIQGVYNYHAVAIAIANAFSDKGKKYEYLKKPFDIFKDDNNIEKQKEVEMLKLKAFLDTLERGVKK